jgi:predicted acyl esterase
LTFKIKVEKDIYVPMRDGVKLCVDIIRPDTEDKYPALLAISAYGKNIQRQFLPQPVPSPLGDACIEAGMSDWIVQRGYVHVIADSRGIGQSEGTYYSMYSEQESYDGYDLVEWIAQQPWCDGQVGMIGISYYGTIQLVVAASCPPHLKAIAPLEATQDQYLACYHGGVLDAFYSELYTGRHSFLSWSGFANKDCRSKSKKDLPKEEYERRLKIAMEDPDINQYNLLYSVLNYPDKNPIFHDILLNPYDDKGEMYWWNPKLEDIKIPVLCGCNWYPDCGPKFVREPFFIYNRVQGPKKLIMFPPGWMDRPFSQHHGLILDWYDYWFKGIQNGIMDEDPIKLFIMGENKYRTEKEWPIGRTEWTSFYLRPHQGLSREPEQFYELEPDGYVQEPLLVTQKINSLFYSTPPLADDLEISGPISLYLYASIDQDDSVFKVKLFDVDCSTGKERELTHGHLKLSHSTLDTERSKPYQPIHNHTKEACKKVQPGEINEYHIEFYPFANVFKKGHKIKLEICSMDIPGVSFSYHLYSSKTVTHKIYRDGKRPSRLYLPVIPR